MIIDTNKLTRLDLIEFGERARSFWDVKVKLSIQDNEKTLKVFVESL